jgi:hypothetical protein
MMARGRSKPSETVDSVAATPLDVWIEQQRDLLDTSLGQWTQGQQALMTAWFQWLDGLSALYRVPSWPGAPEALFMAGPQLLQTWWAPWVPFTERGGEQLG